MKNRKTLAALQAELRERMKEARRRRLRRQLGLPESAAQVSWCAIHQTPRSKLPSGANICRECNRIACKDRLLRIQDDPAAYAELLRYRRERYAASKAA